MRAFFIALALMLLAGGTRAQATATDPVITNLQWDQRPTDEDVYDLYPALALLLSVEGDATVRCVGEASGEITNCEVEAFPQGWAFEQAAQAVVQRGRIRPRTVDGVPEPAPFLFRVRFRLASEADLTYTGREPSPERLATIRARVDEAVDPELMLGSELHGLTSVEVAGVMPPLLVAAAIHREDWVDAFALALGRVLPTGIEDVVSAQILFLLLPAPPPESEMPHFSAQGTSAITDQSLLAFDELDVVQQRIWDTTRRMYCARRDCGDERPELPARLDEAI